MKVVFLLLLLIVLTYACTYTPKGRNRQNRNNQNRNGYKRQAYNRQVQNRQNRNRQAQNRQAQNRQNQNRQNQNRQAEIRRNQNRQAEIRRNQNRQAEIRRNQNRQAEIRRNQNRQAQNRRNQNRQAQNRRNQNRQAQNRPNRNRKPQKCKPRPTTCRLGDGSILKNGASQISKNCRTKNFCTSGHVRCSAFSCPADSACRGGRCICNPGTKHVRTSENGRVQHCKKNQCKVRGQILREGATKMGRSCKKLYTCSHGKVRTTGVCCPKNSRCRNGRCQCDRGSEKIRSTHNGLVEYCKAKQCKVRGQVMKEGSTKLSRGCKQIYTCSNGNVKKSNICCPKHSTCRNGKCQCDSGFKKIRSTHGGLVEYCKPQQCKVKGIVIKEGSTKMSRNCNQIYTCKNGKVKKSKICCPKNSSCRKGRCTCDRGAEQIRSSHDGLVQYCKPKQCKVKGLIIKEGSITLSKGCKALYACSEGTVQTTKIRCPENTSCKNGRCVCNPGAEKTKTEYDGLIEHCEARQCEVDGEIMKEGALKLSDNCQKIYECMALGEVSAEDYVCPEHSSCRDGQCTCDDGTEVVKTTLGGLVEHCQPKQCMVDGEIMEEGSIKLTDGCTKIHECFPLGEVSTDDYACPDHSSCHDGHCSCDEGTEVVDTTHDGLVEHCELKQCMVDGEIMEEGSVQLSDDCSQIHECKPHGEVNTKDYVCPDHSSCHDRHCTCDEGTEVVGISTDGLEEICELKQCKVDGEILEEGSLKLTDGCTKIHECFPLGDVSTNDYVCPDHSSCHDGHCTCDKGTEVVDTTHDGLVEHCEPKQCKVDGEILEEGSTILSLDCTKIHECHPLGEVDTKDFACPEHSICQEGYCLCDLASEVVETTYGGLVETCKLLQCKVNGEVLEEGYAKLSDDCSQIHECMGLGDVRTNDFSCPDYSSCHDGHCKCDRGAEVVDTLYDGLVEECSPRPCMVNGEPMEEGSYTLTDDCSQIHECKPYGEVSVNDFVCPKHSICQDESCTCDGYSDLVDTTYGGLVENCKVTQCFVGVDTIQEGSYKLADDCSVIYECKPDGILINKDYVCPEHSSCYDGHCTCDEGAERVDTTLGGFVETCKVSQCVVDGEVIQEGSYKLTDGCSQIHECKPYGEVNTNDYVCPDHSSCHDGHCTCDEGTEVVDTTHGGLVETCKPTQCKLWGINMKEGSSLLTRNCKKVFTCSQGNVEPSSFCCPKHSSCEKGRCVCDPGMVVTKTTHSGLVQHCEYTGEPTQCKLWGMIMKEDSFLLTRNCKKVFTCSESMVVQSSFCCPKYSHCEEGRCLCNPETHKTGTSHSGLVETCEPHDMTKCGHH